MRRAPCVSLRRDVLRFLKRAAQFVVRYALVHALSGVRVAHHVAAVLRVVQGGRVRRLGRASVELGKRGAGEVHMTRADVRVVQRMCAK